MRTTTAAMLLTGLLATGPRHAAWAQINLEDTGSITDIAPSPPRTATPTPARVEPWTPRARPVATPAPGSGGIGDIARDPVSVPTAAADEAAVRRAMEEVAPLARERKYKEAAALLERHLAGVQSPEGRHLLLYHAGTFHFQAKDLARAEASFNEALTLVPNAPLAMLNLSAVEISLGKAKDALARLDRLQLQFVGDRNIAFIGYFNLACAHAQLGDVDKAVRNLAQAIQRDPLRGLANIGDKQLDPVREDPRFKDLVWMTEQAVQTGAQPRRNP